MYRIFLIFTGFISLLLFSCHKSSPDNNGNNNPNDTTQNNNNTDPPPHNWFKLKTILRTTVYSKSGDVYKDSTDIALDSVNRKITIKQYSNTPYYKDTALEIYSYNKNYQLVLIESLTDNKDAYISSMAFERDATGQVTKVTSAYKNGRIALSDGPVTYAKHGDTTFITYLDSARKDLQQYYTGQDYYTVALLNGKLIADTDFPIKNKSTDTTLSKYEYNGAGDLVTYSEKYGNSAPRITTYQRGGQAQQELQKFFTQWMGDLFWFNRAKAFFPLQQIGYYGYIMGNTMQSMNVENVVIPFTNTFDANGNLTSLSRVGPYDGLGTPTVTEQYRYRP